MTIMVGPQKNCLKVATKTKTRESGSKNKLIYTKYKLGCGRGGWVENWLQASDEIVYDETVLDVTDSSLFG